MQAVSNLFHPPLKSTFEKTHTRSDNSSTELSHVLSPIQGRNLQCTNLLTSGFLTRLPHDAPM